LGLSLIGSFGVFDFCFVFFGLGWVSAPMISACSVVRCPLGGLRIQQRLIFRIGI